MNHIRNITNGFLFRISLFYTLVGMPVLLSVFLSFLAIEYFLYLNQGFRLLIFSLFLLLVFVFLAGYLFIAFKYKDLIILARNRHFAVQGYTQKRNYFQLINFFQLERLFPDHSSKVVSQKALTLGQQFEFFGIGRFFSNPGLRLFLLWFIGIGLLIALSYNKLRDPAIRIIRFETVYKPGERLQYTLTPLTLECIEEEDLSIQLKVTGIYLPDKIFIQHDGVERMLVKEETDLFTYTFTAVRKSFQFAIVQHGLGHSSTFHVEVVPKSRLTNLYLIVTPPEYMRLPVDTIRDLSTVTLYRNSTISIGGRMLNASGILLSYTGDSFSDTLFVDAGHQFRSRKQSITTDQRMTLRTINNGLRSVVDTVSVQFRVLNDKPPVISASMLNLDGYFARISISAYDDFGISRIESLLTGRKDGLSFDLPPVIVTRNFVGTEFVKVESIDFESHFLSYDTLFVQYRVTDNSWSPGQSALSNIIYLKTLKNPLTLLQEYNRLEEATESLNRNQKGIQQLQNEAEKFMNLPALDLLFEQRQMRDRISMETTQFKEKALDIRKEIDELQSADESSEEMRNELQKLLDRLDSITQKALETELNNPADISKMKDELKKLEDLLEKIQSKLNQDITDQKLNQLYQALQQMIQKQINENEELSRQLEGQERDSATDNKAMNTERVSQLLEQHKEIGNTIESMNEELKKGLLGKDEKAKELLRDIEKQYNSVPQQKSPDAKNTLEEINKKYDELKNSIDETLMEMAAEQADIDIRQLRQIIKTGILISKDAEQLSTVKQYGTQTEKTNALETYIDLQKRWPVFRDSVLAFITRSDLPLSLFLATTDQIDKGIVSLKSQIQKSQPIGISQDANQVMGDINKIVLQLSELLKEQEEDKNSIQMGGQCNKPKKKGGKPKQISMGEIRKQQEKLNSQMQKLMEGQNKGGKNPGKELLDLINQQFGLRQQLNQLMKEAEAKRHTQALQGIADEMKRLEQEMMKNRLAGSDLQQRQKTILTRLLETEKALMEQETENRRTSREARDEEWNNHYERRFFTNDKFRNTPEFLKPKSIRTRTYYTGICEIFSRTMIENEGL